jgi:hypothetical protein
MMSAPVHRDEQTDELQFYAPPWVRERLPTAAAHQPSAEIPATAADTGDGEGELPPPLQSPQQLDEDPPARMAQAAEVTADTYQEPRAPARPQPVSSPRMAPGVGGPNIGLRSSPPEFPHADAEHAPATVARAQNHEHGLRPSSGRRPFEGDVAIKALRHRMSLDPQFLPTPPIHARSRRILPLLGRLSVGIGGGAIIAFGIALITRPETRPTIIKEESIASTRVLPQPAGPQLAGVSIPVLPPAKLILEDGQAFTNEALPLGISLNGGAGGEFALLSGLVAGTRISTGSPSGANGWRLAARDLTQALAYAPTDFVGVMEPTIDLRAANDVLVDSRSIRLEWLPKQVAESKRASRLDREDSFAPPPAATLDAEEISTLMRRGQEYLRTGDIAAARLMLRRAANAGNSQAALTLGATFDPLVLGELGAHGFLPDLAQARFWYDRAARLGSIEASRRIEAMARSDP